MDKVQQDFDPSKFNFSKVGQEEVLFHFEESEEDKVHYLEKASVLDSPNVVAINVSGINDDGSTFYAGFEVFWMLKDYVNWSS